jgi:hypothetical protein
MAGLPVMEDDIHGSYEMICEAKFCRSAGKARGFEVPEQRVQPRVDTARNLDGIDLTLLVSKLGVRFTCVLDARCDMRTSQAETP